MKDLPWNNSILCVDDERGILETYKKILTHAEKSLLLASSGEKAIEIARKELNFGRQIAAGFFDMEMPGGIDGQETIRRILQLDNQMLKILKITVSIGLVALTPSAEDTLESLLKRADEALYQAKKKGRNCCVISDMMDLVSPTMA